MNNFQHFFTVSRIKREILINYQFKILLCDFVANIPSVFDLKFKESKQSEISVENKTEMNKFIGHKG